MRNSTIDFSELAQYGNFNELSLTIYHFCPFKLTPFSVTNDGLKNDGCDYRIIIEGNELERYTELLTQLDDIVLTPVEQESYIDARLYYIFEHRRSGATFSVAMSGHNYSMFVNGNEVERNDTLYDVIMPFLPDDLAQELQTYIERN